MIEAWVVFGETDIWWLRFLKKGFRHCFVIIKDNGWITYEPLCTSTEIRRIQVPEDFNMPEWYTKEGFIVMPAKIKEPDTISPISIYTCVEAVKRVLGIQSARVLTPYQLYKHLKKGK